MSRAAALALALLFVVPSSILVAPAAAQASEEFDVQEIPFAPVALTPAATVVAMSDNEVTAAFSLGFQTTFFGQTAFDFWIGSNGFVTLHFLTPDGCCGGDPIPTPGGPDGMVAALWTDLDPSVGGTIRFERVDIGGVPAVVVEYDDVPVKNDLTQTVSFQVHILQNGTIETHYERFHTPSGLDVTIGLENIDGSRGVEVFHGPGTGNTSTEVALRFVPLETTPSPPSAAYTVEEIPGGLLAFDPERPIGGISLGDDEVSNTVSLGFETLFFGSPTSSFQVSSNGFVYLAPGSDSGCCSGEPIPSSGSPNGMIAGFWTDLHPGVGGSITTQTRTIDGELARIIQFEDVHFCCGVTQPTVTFQTLIFADGTLQLRYGTNAFTGSSTTTIGLENQEGTGGVQVFNGQNEDFAGLAFQFTPATALAYDVVEVPSAPFSHTGNATQLALGDDFVTSAIPLGFQTSFFDIPTSEFWVSSNGFVTLHFLTPDGCCEGQPLPTAGGPDGMIAGYWTDLDPTSGGTVGFERFDTGTQAALAVSYDSVPVKGANDTVTFQVIVFENGTFELHYLGATIHEGFNTTIGAENIDATDAVELFHGDASEFAGNDTVGDGNTTSGGDTGDGNTTATSDATNDPSALIDGPVLNGRSFRFTPSFDLPEAPPQIVDLSPTEGPSGTLVTLSGDNFHPDATITFGGEAVSFVIDNQTGARFVAPGGFANGFHEVRLRNPDGQSDSVRFGLTNPFSLQAVEPNEARQGEHVLLFGSFPSDTEVLLDGRFANAIHSDSSLVVIQLPVDQEPGVYDVTVRDGSGTQSTLEDALVVRGLPDVAVVALETDRADVQTAATPDGTHAIGSWLVEATITNAGDAPAEEVEVRFLTGQTDGLGPLRSGDWEVIETFIIDTWPTDEGQTFHVLYDGPTGLGDRQFRVETEVKTGLSDRFAENDAAESEDYLLVGGMGGLDPTTCQVAPFGVCASETLRWEDHETVMRDQVDRQTGATVRLDAVMKSPDFTFNNFDLVFTNHVDFPDGSFEECTTWRFVDREDGFFRVTMTPSNGIDGTVTFSGGEATVLFGERVIERKSQLILDAALTQVVLLETPTEREFEGAGPAADEYTFRPTDPDSGDRFGWSTLFQGLSGDFTHCALRFASGGGEDSFTFAALPADLDARVASFEGAGTATVTQVLVDEQSTTVTHRPVTDGV